MKTNRISAEVPEQMHRLMKASAAVVGIPMNDVIQAMALYFWGFAEDDKEIQKYRRQCSAAVMAVTEGKRPFNCGAVVQN